MLLSPPGCSIPKLTAVATVDPGSRAFVPTAKQAKP